MKNDSKKYSLKKKSNYWYVLNPNGIEILSSRGGEFYIENENFAQILVKDLNELLEVKDDESNKTSETPYKESLIYWVLTNLILDDILDEIELNRERLMQMDEFVTPEIKIESLTDIEILVIMLLENYFSLPMSESYIEWVAGVKSTDDFLLSWSDWILPENSEKVKIKFNNLKLFLEQERSFQVKIISYTVKYPSTKKDEKWIVKTFEHDDFLEAREKAIELVKKEKEKNDEYKGIQLLLNYLDKNPGGNYKKKTHKILTGNRMGTHKILPSLAFECQLLESANEKFPKMLTKFEGKEFLAVNQAYTSLYYFTVD